MKSKGKFILALMIFVGISFFASVFTFRGIIEHVKIDSKETTESFKEEQFNVIWSSLHSLLLQSEKEVSSISFKIESDILNLPEERLSQLQYDLTNDIHNNDLHQILMENIEFHNLNNIANHRNGIVVMSTKGYIEDFNYRRAKVFSHDETNSFRNWQDSIDKSYNSSLEKNAIEKLLNRTSGIIALESYDLTKNEDHIQIKEMTYDSLLQVFLKEGMEGLRNYQIFVPYYITDFGDIFGTPDILQGIKVENNKIIIIQEFNLYDQITNNNSMINNDHIENINKRSSELLGWIYLTGLLLIAAVVGLIFYFCTVYNSMIEYEEIHEQLLQYQNEALSNDKQCENLDNND